MQQMKSQWTMSGRTRLMSEAEDSGSPCTKCGAVVKPATQLVADELSCYLLFRSSAVLQRICTQRSWDAEAEAPVVVFVRVPSLQDCHFAVVTAGDPVRRASMHSWRQCEPVRWEAWADQAEPNEIGESTWGCPPILQHPIGNSAEAWNVHICLVW